MRHDSFQRAGTSLQDQSSSESTSHSRSHPGTQGHKRSAEAIRPKIERVAANHAWFPVTRLWSRYAALRAGKFSDCLDAGAEDAFLNLDELPKSRTRIWRRSVIPIRLRSG